MDLRPSEIQAIKDYHNMKDTYCVSCEHKFVDCNCNDFTCIREAVDIDEDSVYKLIDAGYITIR